MRRVHVCVIVPFYLLLIINIYLYFKDVLLFLMIIIHLNTRLVLLFLMIIKKGCQSVL